MLFSKLPLQALALASTSSVIASPLGQGPAALPDLVSYAGKPEFHHADFIANEPLADTGLAELQTRAPPAISSDQLGSLRLHNVARAQKKLKAVLWDPALESAALQWAQYIAGINSLQHSDISQRPGQGENLAYAKSSQPIPNPATVGTQLWVDEIVNYNNEPIPEGNFEGYGHYTQVVWSSTWRIGVATARSADGAYYTVARYGPAGNIGGQTPFGQGPVSGT